MGVAPNSVVQMGNAYPYNSKGLYPILYNNEKERDDLYGYRTSVITPNWSKSFLTHQYNDPNFQSTAFSQCFSPYVQSSPGNMYDLNARVYERSLIQGAEIPEAARWQTRAIYLQEVNNLISKTRDPYLQPRRVA